MNHGLSFHNCYEEIGGVDYQDHGGPEVKRIFWNFTTRCWSIDQLNTTKEVGKEYGIPTRDGAAIR